MQGAAYLQLQHTKATILRDSLHGFLADAALQATCKGCGCPAKDCARHASRPAVDISLVSQNDTFADIYPGMPQVHSYRMPSSMLPAPFPSRRSWEGGQNLKGSEVLYTSTHSACCRASLQLLCTWRPRGGRGGGSL